MILLIDNFDSFVFNLARYVAELGHTYQVVRNDAITLAEIESLAPSHIIISPGPCSPNEAGISMDLIRAFQGKIPILGVCLGHQAIAAALGGVVQRAATPKHGKSDQIFHNGQNVFKDLPNPLTIARYHSLIVEEAGLPSCLEITARTAENEIMALAHKEYPLYGVQFHPESILTQDGHGMLKNFIHAVALT